MHFDYAIRRQTPFVLCTIVLVIFSGCADAPAPDQDSSIPDSTSAGAAAAVAEPAATDGPPLGRYVCRQHTTTMGYLTLEEGGAYEVSGVRGRYAFDSESGAMNWEGGSYDEWGWEGTYEHVSRPEGDGRPDEDIIRIVSASDGLKIDCYKTAED